MKCNKKNKIYTKATLLKSQSQDFICKKTKKTPHCHKVEMKN